MEVMDANPTVWAAPALSRVSIRRVKWLTTYYGPRRWEAKTRASEAGWIALQCDGGHGITGDGTYNVIDSKYLAYTHRLYVVNGRRFIIGDFRNYPVSAPLYEVTDAN